MKKHNKSRRATRWTVVVQVRGFAWAGARALRSLKHMKENPLMTKCPFQAMIVHNGLILAKGEVTRYSRSIVLSFHPSNGEILDTPYPEASLIVAGKREERVLITNLRQCSASKMHWDFELAP